MRNSWLSIVSLTPSSAWVLSNTVFGVVVVGLYSSCALGQTTRDWTAAGASDAYANPANWSDANVPDTTSESARFNLVGFYDVTFVAGSNTSVSDLTVLDGRLDFSSDGASNAIYEVDDDLIVTNGASLTLALSASGGDVQLSVGDELRITNGTVNIRNGLLEINDLRLADSGVGNGALVVTGSDSELLQTGFGLINIGQDGIGTLDVASLASVSFTSVVQLANFAGAGNRGIIRNSGGDLSFSSLLVATGGTNATALGYLGLSRGLSITEISQSLTVGNNTVGGPSAEVEVVDGALLTIDGPTTINDSGVIGLAADSNGFLGDPGIIQANGLISLSAGARLANDGGILRATAGIDSSLGGTIVIRDGLIEVTGGPLLLTGDGVLNDFKIDGFDSNDLPHLSVGAGVAGSVNGSLTVGVDNSARLTIQDGAQLSNLVGIVSLQSGGAGQVLVTGTDGLGVPSRWINTAKLWIGFSDFGSLTIEQGAEVFNTTGRIGRDDNSEPGRGQVVVTGVGSRWQNSAGLFVGTTNVAEGGNGLLHIEDQAEVEVVGALTIEATGRVVLDGGKLVTDTLDHNNGGQFDFIAGSLTLNDGIQVGAGNAFPRSLTLTIDQTLITSGDTQVAASRTLALGGGTLKTNRLTVDGSFNFYGGRLEVTGGGVTGLPAMAVPSGGELLSKGQLVTRVSAASGSIVTATGDLLIGDKNAVNGFYANGELRVSEYTVFLQDANGAVLDSGALATLGAGSSGGTLESPNGLTLDFGGNITGFGTVETPNDPASPLINNGSIIGDSRTKQITLTGYVKGVGSCDQCMITGTDAPGFSPASLNRGSVTYRGTLEIELGGLRAGSEFDQLNHSLGAGIADLGGVLDVQLINGFSPSAGDKFEIINATNILGTFSVETLPALAGDLEWFVNYRDMAVELIATFTGDSDFDGDVDGADFLNWQRGGTIDPLSAMDLADWQENYGTNVPSLATSTAVPEPSTGIMFMLGMWTIFSGRRMALRMMACAAGPN